MTSLLTFALASVLTAQGSAEDLLKATMDRYHSLKTFQASCDWQAKYGKEQGASLKRTIAYRAPNLFKFTTTNSNGFNMTSISDGKRLLELSQAGNQEYQAPEKLWEADSMQLKHPMFCGTLLHQVFGGSANLDGLLDRSKGAIRFGPDESMAEAKLKVVKFWGADSYGTTEFGIDNAQTIRFIRYHSEPLKEAMKKQGDGDEAVITTETYTNIRFDEPIADETFVARAPDGETVEPAEESGDKPPVDIGKPAPDFTVTSMTGQKTKLSSLRGNVVYIDFWATWCPPCRATLPETQKLFKQVGGKGLKVLAISDEDKKTVSAFLKANKYTFPSYLDGDNSAAKAYNIQGIPTFVVIDAKGNLVDFIVGGGQESRVRAALKKAGIKL
jgi:thiol-disulfide isomerase/thioredoxin/outer membrane lipoprotein-sorting protein